MVTGRVELIDVQQLSRDATQWYDHEMLSSSAIVPDVENPSGWVLDDDQASYVDSWASATYQDGFSARLDLPAGMVVTAIHNYTFTYNSTKGSFVDWYPAPSPIVYILGPDSGDGPTYQPDPVLEVADADPWFYPGAGVSILITTTTPPASGIEVERLAIPGARIAVTAPVGSGRFRLYGAYMEVTYGVPPNLGRLEGSRARFTG